MQLGTPTTLYSITTKILPYLSNYHIMERHLSQQ